MEATMNIHALFLMITVFFAAAVESIEMMTIVLGVGMTRSWMPTLFGGAVGLIVLAIVVAVFGPLLTIVPINVLRAVVGILLLFFGLQWLRKSIFRISLHGWGSGKEKEEEEQASENSGASLSDVIEGKIDWTAFVLSFKGVLLEGLEIAFIVVTFGAAVNRVGLAAVAAAVAFGIIVIIGVVARTVLQNVPGNVIKYAVGLLLVTYGSFWSAKGLGASWPGSDLAILGLLALYFLFSYGFIQLLKPKLRESGA
jgi:uncharacterized membrane protein